MTVSNVVSGSPADQAGLKIGDTITAVDGKDVKSGDDLVADIASRKPGSKAKLDLCPQRQEGGHHRLPSRIARSCSLPVSAMTKKTRAKRNPKPANSAFPFAASPGDLADRLNIPAGKGVVVQDVKQGSFGHPGRN